MSLAILGRRYERLLFLAAPLSLASVLTLFVVFATESQKERGTARCYESAAQFLDAKQDILQGAWSSYQADKKSTYNKLIYSLEIKTALMHYKLDRNCAEAIINELEDRAKDEPKVLIDRLRREAKQLYATPLRYAGVELPDKATLTLLGTSVSVDLTLFAGLLQVVLAPLMLLWLGSLYNTRYRETLLIENARLVTEVFPHLVNVYPAMRYPEPRRRVRFQVQLKSVFAFLYTATRIALLSLFIGPSVAAYISGIIILSASEYFLLLYCLGGLVAIFAAALILVEFFPWHYWKTFPGPPLFDRKDD